MSVFSNKCVFISGATSGIGEACAFRLAKAGFDLVLHGRSKEKLSALAASLSPSAVRIRSVAFDVRDSGAVQSALKVVLEEGNIDILINNAGLALGLERLDEGDATQWDIMIDTNIKGLLYVTRALLPGMRSRNAGHILNIGSIAGRTAYPGGNVYAATKAAVHMLSDAINIDVADTAIRVGTIAPGAVETNFSNTRFDGDGAKVDAVYEGYKPLHADDIADVVLYVLNAPAHVNIQDILIMPTAQRNPFVLNRKKN